MSYNSLHDKFSTELPCCRNISNNTSVIVDPDQTISGGVFAHIVGLRVNYMAVDCHKEILKSMK